MDLRDLPPYLPRRFVPDAIDLADFSQVAPLFDRLEAEASELADAEELEEWVLRADELASSLDQVLGVRYVEMIASTADPRAEARYLQFLGDVVAPAQGRWRILDRRFLESPHRARLLAERWFVHERAASTAVGLFVEANIPLSTRERHLAQQYGKRTGQMTVRFREQDQTADVMAMHLQEPDPVLREDAWRTVAGRRLEERAHFDDLFDSLVETRYQLARNAGFADYCEFGFRWRGRYDYGVAECKAFRGAVEDAVVPLLRGLQEHRRERLGVATLRPWDLNADPDGRPPLRPFANVAELVLKTRETCARIEPGLADSFDVLCTHGVLDLVSRPGKVPGGLHVPLDEARLPIVFANLVGNQRDVLTMLHEAGHAMHYLAARGEPLHRYRHAPSEFAELVAIAMELLALEHLDVFYSLEEARRARRDYLEGLLAGLVRFALLDEFERWVHAHPHHRREDRTAAWLHLRARLGGVEDWTGLEEELATEWHRIRHLFEFPLYQMAYAVATVGALQVWRRVRTEGPHAVLDLRAAMAMGGSRALPELFRTAGIRLDFSTAVLQPLVAEVVRAYG